MVFERRPAGAGNSVNGSRVIIADNTAPDTQITDGPTGEITIEAATFTGSDKLTPAFRVTTLPSGLALPDNPVGDYHVIPER